MKEENDIELCHHMSKLMANHGVLNALWRDGKLMALADRLANIQAAARNAEQRLNDIIFRSAK